jgi:hypothetical protein
VRWGLRSHSERCLKRSESDHHFSAFAGILFVVFPFLLSVYLAFFLASFLSEIYNSDSVQREVGSASTSGRARQTITIGDIT